MNIVEFADAEAMWAASEPYLSIDAANNTHSLSALRRLRRDGAKSSEKFWVATRSDGAPIGSLLRVDTRHAFLSYMAVDVARALGEAAQDRRVELEGVVGAAETVAAFVSGFGRPTRPYAQLMLYQHQGEIVGGEADGRARVAATNDLATVVAMLDAFDLELSMIKSSEPTVRRAQRRIAAEEITVWQRGDEVVAMAGANPLPAQSARVGPVYVRPDHRRSGVAQAVTAAATQHIQRDGPRTVFLFTDARNPASNKAYQRIGYRHIADHLHLLF